MMSQSPEKVKSRGKIPEMEVNLLINLVCVKPFETHIEPTNNFIIRLEERDFVTHCRQKNTNYKKDKITIPHYLPVVCF